MLTSKFLSNKLFDSSYHSRKGTEDMPQPLMSQCKKKNLKYTTFDLVPTSITYGSEQSSSLRSSYRPATTRKVFSSIGLDHK